MQKNQGTHGLTKICQETQETKILPRTEQNRTEQNRTEQKEVEIFKSLARSPSSIFHSK